MQLSPEEVVHFFRLMRSLIVYTNHRLGVLDRLIAGPEDLLRTVSVDDRAKIHQALYAHPELFGAFAAENPAGFPVEDLEIVRSWKHFVSGEFFAYRQFRKYMVFLTAEESPIAYGVVALGSRFDEMLGTDLPRQVRTTLLPFQGRIVFDGLMTASRISFGSNFRRSLDESYEEANARGIITTLPASTIGLWPVAPAPEPSKRTPKRRPTKAKAESSKATAPALDRVVALLEAFCREHLDDEYEELCVLMARELARKRPSPLASGKPESWAAGIARVIASTNFVDDPSQPNHMRLSDIGGHFGVSDATASAKATAIRKALDVGPRFEPRWTVTSMLIQNPMVWMIEVNGLIMDVRRAPRPIQEEAFRKGLIPFIPDDADSED